MTEGLPSQYRKTRTRCDGTSRMTETSRLGTTTGIPCGQNEMVDGDLGRAPAQHIWLARCLHAGSGLRQALVAQNAETAGEVLFDGCQVLDKDFLA
jgi:hypothetical protein